jgi:GDSL-like Lipase/Acylhydrolase family
MPSSSGVPGSVSQAIHWDGFSQKLALVAALTVGLVAFAALPRWMPMNQARIRVEKLLAVLQNGALNREDFDALAAGYYEGLQKDAGHLGMPAERDDVRFRNDFLLYDFKPNVRRDYPAGLRVTNSLGMPNPEYGYLKPPHTRRIALLGDSISVGPYGQDYEALLERRLNQSNTTAEIQKFEILNFSVYGYNALQMMDVAVNIAPKFHPDVYLVALTHIQAGGRKASTAVHIARLELEGIDLKYDFLRQIAAQAHLQRGDHLNTMVRKLAPYHLQMTRWALEQIRNEAAAEGAQMVIALVPAPIPVALEAQAFDEIRPTIESLGIPVIDLRDTFKSKPIEKLQVEYGIDVHPNQSGHEVIYQSFYQAMQQDPRFAAALLGTAVEQSQSLRSMANHGRNQAASQTISF